MLHSPAHTWKSTDLAVGARALGALGASDALTSWRIGSPGPCSAGVLPPGEVGGQAHATDSFMPNLPLILGLGNYLKDGQILGKLFYQI